MAALAASGNEPVDLRAAFAKDPERASRLTVQTGDLVADLSKHLVTVRRYRAGRNPR